MPADLTISIVNHSNPELLGECLRSLYAATHDIEIDVCIIDNATGRRLVADIQAEFPAARWLFNKQQLGFSANHNQVLGSAESRYVCILNDDTIIHDGMFDTLVKYLDENPRVGMAGPRILNPDGTQQCCVFHFMTLGSELLDIMLLPGILCGLKRVGINSRQDGDRPADVDWVLGACIVARNATVRRIGLLDDVLSPIANTEEVDWCYRAHKSGWRVAFCPAAV